MKADNSGPCYEKERLTEEPSMMKEAHRGY
jgi:hypothetical protein